MLKFFWLKIRLRKLHYAVFLTMAACSFYIALLPGYHHGIRASLMPVENISDDRFFNTPPGQMPYKMRFENPELLTGFRDQLPDSLRNPNFRTISGIMYWIGQKYADSISYSSNWIPESPDVIQNYLQSYKVRGSCYNDAIIYSAFAQSIGLKVRIIGFDGYDGWGGLQGHSIAAVWSDEYQKWVLVDQQQCAVFYSSVTGIPLSAREIRKVLLENSLDSAKKLIRIEQGRGYTIAKEEILAFYKPLVADYFIVANSDFYTAKQATTSRAIASFIEETEPYFGKYAVWLGRLVRAHFGNTFLRFRFVDKWTPAINFSSWYILYRLVWLVWLLCLAHFMFYGLRWLFRHRHLDLRSVTRQHTAPKQSIQTEEICDKTA